MSNNYMQVVDIPTNSRVQTDLGRVNENEAVKDNQRLKITNKNSKYQKNVILCS